MASPVRYLEVRAKSNVKHGGKFYRSGDVFRVSKETARILTQHHAAVVLKPSGEDAPERGDAKRPEETK